jgi:hypothetical protein
VAPNTVVRYSRLAGGHARALHDEFVAFSPPDPGGPVRREVVVRLRVSRCFADRRWMIYP